MPGFHVMRIPTSTKHWVETLSGLGGCGVQAVLVWHSPGSTPVQAHPFLPTLQLTARSQAGQEAPRDMDVVFDATDSTEQVQAALNNSLSQVLSREYSPKLSQRNTDFQISRGYNVSL